MDISRAIPSLLENNVRVVAVGLESLGVDEFVDGGFWKGELYIDQGKKAYKALNLKSSGVMGALNQLFLNRKVKAALARSKNVAGNLAGDGLQLGGTYVFAKGGAVRLEFRQETFADHPTPEELLRACGLDTELPPPKNGDGGVANSCADTACKA